MGAKGRNGSAEVAARGSAGAAGYEYKDGKLIVKVDCKDGWTKFENNGSVAHLDRAWRYGRQGGRFDPYRSHQK